MSLRDLLNAWLSLSLILSTFTAPLAMAGQDDEETPASLAADAAFWSGNDDGLRGRATGKPTTSDLPAKPLAVFGTIPGEYLGKKDAAGIVGKIVVGVDGIISEIVAVDAKQVPAEAKKAAAAGMRVIVAQTDKTFDVLYPGMINLHNHNKQNVLPTWTTAKGRFSNRFEWRQKVAEYNAVQGDNMNPWSALAPAKIAAYRWTEMQTMIQGTTYLQGATLAHKNFGIQSVEDTGSYHSKRTAVQSPGDLIDPDKWNYLWTTIRPIIHQLGCLGKDEKCYGKAVTQLLNDKCSGAVPQTVIDNPYDMKSVNWLLDHVEFMYKAEAREKAKADLKAAEEALENAEQASGGKAGLPAQRALKAAQDAADLLRSQANVKPCKLAKGEEEAFVKYFATTFGNLPHKEAISRFETLKDKRHSAIVTHLAEGRRNDPYNWTEFQMLKLAGLALPGMSFVHGLGLTQEDFKVMAQQHMGLVWSPYSNFLLYGETIDIAGLLEAGVTVALGSDWTPTGSKGVLDELHLAAAYRAKAGINEKLLSDKVLFEMVTKNPAIIINHFGFESKDEHGVGTLQVGAMGSFIAVRNQNKDVYTNLVVNAKEQDINLLVIDGKPQYGNQSYLAQFDKGATVEVISGQLFTKTIEANPDSFPYSGASENDIAGKATDISLTASTACGFKEPKVMVNYLTADTEDKTAPFLRKTDLDLDTYKGIVRFLGVALLSQCKNVEYSAKGLKLKTGVVKVMPPLYGCEDKTYTGYLANMAAAGKDTLDEMEAQRSDLREAAGLYSDGAKKKALAQEYSDNYGLPYTEEKSSSGKIIDVWLDRNSSSYSSFLSDLGY